MTKYSIKKKVLAKLDSCYSVETINVNGESRLIAASEQNAPCYQFRGEEYTPSPVWYEPGGTMAFAPIPGGNGAFFAVQNFYPVFDAAASTVVRCSPKQDGTWDISHFMDIPYIHRISIIESDEKFYFIAATLCAQKQNKDDWSSPGSILSGELNIELNTPPVLKPVMEGLYFNHGFCKTKWKNKESVLVAAQEGLYILSPPDHSQKGWKSKILLEKPISDAAVSDINDDGELEIATIEPFHGNKICIYKKTSNEYKCIWEYEGEDIFAHVIWGGKIRGIQTFIVGYRKNDARLFMVQKNSINSTQFDIIDIDTEGGPSNITVLNEDDKDTIYAANNKVGEVTAYIISD